MHRPARIAARWALLLLCAVRPAAAAVEEVIVVFKTHFDIGYTAMAADVLKTYRTTMIDKALDVVDATRNLPAEQQFVWTLPGWPLGQILHAGQEPVRADRIRRALRDGRFVFHALPFTTHTESLELEELVRGLRFSSELAAGLELPPPRDAKMTDVPSHCWALPTLLAGAGVDFLHLGCNRASTPPRTPPLFWWEGPGGARVMTMLVLGYGTGLTPPADWPHRTWLALIHTGDNHGPPTPEEVKALIAQAGRELPGVRVRMGRLSDFADAIRRENATLPIVRADMPDTWIHGLLSQPAATGLARRTRPRLAALEALNTLMGCWQLDRPDIRAQLATAYEQSLLYGEHTWGIDVKRFPRLYGEEWRQARAAGKYAALEASWAEHAGYIETAARIAEPLLADHMEKLARAVNVSGPRLVVFNPLAWPRDGQVSIPAGKLQALALRDVETGTITPVQRDGEQVVFTAGNVPAMGYRTYIPVPETAPTPEVLRPAGEADFLENEYWRVRVDAQRGGIASLVEKRTGREWVMPGEVLGAYLYQRFDASDPARYVKQYAQGDFPWIEGDFGKPGLPPAGQEAGFSAELSGWAPEISAGPAFARVTLRAGPDAKVPHDVAIAVTLHAGSPCLDIEWSIRDKPPTPWPEAGWLCLPIQAAAPRYRLARLGALVDPATDLQPGSNVDLFCLNGGMGIRDEAGGLGICPLDSPLVSIGRPGLWRYSSSFAPESSRVYVNLYNNQWSTNFVQWIGGSWSSRVRIWPDAGAGSRFGDAQSEAALISASMEARSPLMAISADGPHGTLPPVQPGLALDRRGVAVTAFGNQGLSQTVLRLWELAGQGGPCQVRLPAGAAYTRAQPCDLRGRPAGEAVGIRKHVFEVPLDAHAVRSFALE